MTACFLFVGSFDDFAGFSGLVVGSGIVGLGWWCEMLFSRILWVLTCRGCFVGFDLFGSGCGLLLGSNAVGW